MGQQKTRTIALACAAAAMFAGILSLGMAVQEKIVPDHTSLTVCQPCHAEKQSMWEASGHSKAIGAISNSKQASADCYACHSAEGFAAKIQGNKVDATQKETFHTVSCLACHSPRNTEHPRRLVLDPEKLCATCHSQAAFLKGSGARGVEDTRSVHSAVPCVSCHMTGGNHLMKVIRPDDPKLTDESVDTCTACHKDNNRKARSRQLQEWQQEYKEKTDALQADLNAIGTVLKDKPDILTEDLKKKLGDLRFNLGILARDGSRSAHNFDYTMEILYLAANDIKELKAALK
jgi:predicted CXXCH cytochrome family protein